MLNFRAPDWFDDEWMSKVKRDTGDNWRLKVKISVVLGVLKLEPEL